MAEEGAGGEGPRIGPEVRFLGIALLIVFALYAIVGVFLPERLYRWVLYGHVIGALLFMLSHGVSAAIVYRLRGERDPDRVAVLLDLSGSSYLGLSLSLVAILATGIAMGVMAGWWQRGWFWASLVVFFGMAFAMTPLAATPANKVRQALGLRFPSRMVTMEPAEQPPTPQELDALLTSLRPTLNAAIGIGGILILVWLMMFKPF